MTIESHKDLQVWQQAIDVVVAVCGVAQEFPAEERFKLTSQLQRAAVSIPANIAEAHGRGSAKAFLHFLWIANGSLKEVDMLLIIATRLEYKSRQRAQRLFDQLHEIGRKITGLRTSLKSR